MRYLLPLLLVAVLSSTSAAAQDKPVVPLVVPCPGGKCPAPAAKSAPVAAVTPVRTTARFFREVRPVRRLVAAPFRLVFGGCR
jgi:hypothetical protein